jgi:hypothetical protein
MCHRQSLALTLLTSCFRATRQPARRTLSLRRGSTIGNCEAQVAVGAATSGGATLQGAVQGHQWEAAGGCNTGATRTRDDNTSVAATSESGKKSQAILDSIDTL